MGGVRVAYWRGTIRVVEEDIITFNVKERILIFARKVLDLVKK